ncbi:MAG: type 1 glutamine amidotransferase [Phycisphaerales bacterium]|nr:type 1 glutamine amidotransferase [Phycisphaerales bacterium]
MASILVLQHSERCKPGRLGEVLVARGRRLDVRFVGRDGAGALPTDLREYAGVLSLGGPQNLDEAHAWMPAEMALLKRAHEAGLGVVGICLGHQLLAGAMGGRVAAMPTPEVGFRPVTLTPPGRDDPVLAGQQWTTMQFCSHGQEVAEPPPGAVVLAGSAACRVQAYRLGARSYGFQYHFEWTRPMLRAVSASEDTLLSRCALTLGDIDEQCDTHYARFEEVSTRLCGQIAAMVLTAR